ncbi:MAG: anhydro-N-acetylmuramic acid kinase [Sphingobacteriales bacterium]|nr:anhydro-N-acetylmuramic acid kinase [Sphingobacteriales bacterium]
MVYSAIGLMSGSSLDGLDIAFVEFQEQGGHWSYEILEAECSPYSKEWQERLKTATGLSAKDYLLLHAEYGHYTGRRVNAFIEQHGLQYKVAVIASHGHTAFHLPAQGMTAQLGEGAAIAAETQLPVVSDFRALDIALGGQGAPIVPVGEKMLLGEYDYFLNIGGIANISLNADHYIAFDVCPANRVLNMLAADAGREMDEGGQLAASGKIEDALLGKLNGADYYRKPWPKSLANEFGTEIIYPLIREAGLSPADALCTYTEHIAEQVSQAVTALPSPKKNARLLVTGGGAFNRYLLQRLDSHLSQKGISTVLPDSRLVNYKEALIMAFLGVLRWRQEYNTLSSVTGAARQGIGGALWTGQEA